MDWSAQADAIWQHILDPTSDSNWAKFPNPLVQKNVLKWGFWLQDDLLSDGDLGEKHDWKDIYVVGKLKQSLDEIQTKDMLLQLALYVQEVFITQPTQLFVHAFTVCRTKFEAWVFNYSRPYSSGMLDIYKNMKQFFQVILGYTIL
ncbi:uncharacterized protein CIMG_13212 [Coccidioides immitis RS]|uniref:Fungal-type protein kinase domain-containing protein n=1 Tax=Coccidioides immitis (strain RS) TaxID=246410 RepID=A0A0D8JTV7_COCIM|nr:uncharacterized protein CIMG_13212 [Coccidioides immitis RS]KJF60775.1 hypothetical protein CIMG_13212 [Coccidioides immitis RS]